MPAVVATALVGTAQTDLGQLGDAERSCSAAFRAASALNSADASVMCAVALARTLAWQERHSDAQGVLESMTPTGDAETMARYWCLVARLRMSVNSVAEAWRAVERARPAGHSCPVAIEALVRRWEAAVQARVGDVEAMRHHIRAGLTAARIAHLPLQAIKLRLVLIGGLVDAGRLAPARAAAAHLRGRARTASPPLLKMIVDRTLTRMSGIGDAGVRPQPDRARESASVSFQPPHAPGAVSDVDGLRDLLSCSQQFEDEAEALTRAAASIRKHAHALGVDIFGCVNGAARLFGSAGSSSPALALRCFNAGIPIGPEPSNGWVDAAISVRYLGRFIGAVTIRWTSDGPPHEQRAMAFGLAAAAACAPLVYVLLERLSVPTGGSANFDLVGASAAIDDLRKAIARAANAPFTVLIEGESGSGKELVARAIHRAGCRRERRVCAINCAAMPEDLVDTELFGHVGGGVHGCGDRACGSLRKRRRRYGVSGRSGGVVGSSAGESPARAPGRRGAAHRRERLLAVRRAAGGRHEPIAARGGRRRPVPAGSPLLSRCHLDSRAAAAAADRRYSTSGCALLERGRGSHEQQSRARTGRAFCAGAV